MLRSKHGYIKHDIRYIPIFDILIQLNQSRYCITRLMYHDIAIYRYIVASLVCTRIYIRILYIIVNPRGSSPHYLMQYHVQVTGCDLCLTMIFSDLRLVMIFIRYFCNLLWTINEIYIIIHHWIFCVKKVSGKIIVFSWIAN